MTDAKTIRRILEQLQRKETRQLLILSQTQIEIAHWDDLLQASLGKKKEAPPK